MRSMNPALDQFVEWAAQDSSLLQITYERRSLDEYDELL